MMFVHVPSELIYDSADLYSRFQIISQSSGKNMHASRLHFAIINNWGEEAYILARKSVCVNQIASLFHLRPSEQLVFSRN